MSSEESETGTSRAPAPFNHDEWVRYTQEHVNTAILAVLGGLLFLVGLSWSASALVIEPAGNGFAVEHVGPGFIYGAVVNAGGTILLSWAPRRYRQAQHVRRMAEARGFAATMFMTVFATVVLKRLKAAASGESTKQEAAEGDSNEQ